MEGPREFTNTYPVDFNGYVVVGRPLLRIPANEVRRGDIFISDGYISKVYSAEPLSVPGYDMPDRKGAIKINGEINVIRFPWEIVTVLRETDGLNVNLDATEKKANS